MLPCPQNVRAVGTASPLQHHKPSASGRFPQFSSYCPSSVQPHHPIDLHLTFKLKRNSFWRVAWIKQTPDLSKMEQLYSFLNLPLTCLEACCLETSCKQPTRASAILIYRQVNSRRIHVLQLLVPVLYQVQVIQPASDRAL